MRLLLLAILNSLYVACGWLVWVGLETNMAKDRFIRIANKFLVKERKMIFYFDCLGDGVLSLLQEMRAKNIPLKCFNSANNVGST